MFPALFAVRVGVETTTVVWPEGLGQWKFPMTPSEIQHATFLNELRHRMPTYVNYVL